MNIVTHEQDEEDVITGLKKKTQFGRPNWEDIFSQISKDHQG